MQKFADCLSRISPSEFEVKETREANNSASYLEIEIWKMRKFYGRYGELVKHYNVPLSRMENDILDDHFHPQNILVLQKLKYPDVISLHN